MASNDRQPGLYRLALVATVLATSTSMALTIANFSVAFQRRAAGKTNPGAVAAPFQPERQFRADASGKTRREFKVLGLDILGEGFLSPRAATAMLVGTFFWPLLFFGYRADMLARQREEQEANALPR
jgi:hypothetical protein